MKRTLTLLLLACGPALAGEAREIDSPDYRRPDRKPPAARRAPTRAPLPEALRIEQPPALSKARPHHGRPENGHERPDDRLDALEARARAEARWAAQVLVDERGRPAYYRVGFWSGLRAAHHDPSIGRYDYEVGLRQGAKSARARAEGRAFGQTLAGERAAVDATRAVEAQFTDLGHEPRFLPAPVAPRLDVDPPHLPQPTLRSVMRDHPLAAHHGLLGPQRELVAGWGHDPYRLYEAGDHRAFHDAGWRDPARAFDWWTRRRPATYRRLRNGYERTVFAAEFRRAFRHFVARHVVALERAHDAGIDAGFSYGAFVAEELQYRRGYHHGFGERYVSAVRRTFDRAYPHAWSQDYAAAFDDWSRNAKPAIVGARLHDGNADGVFEPGEPLRVEYDVVNYGGAPGDVPVRLSGAALEREAYARLYLPARASTSALLDSVAIRSTVRPRTHAGLDLVVAGERERLSVHVRRPLRFVPASLRLDRDNLGGRLRVEIAVENISTRAIADVGVHATSAGFFESRGLPELDGGEAARLTFAMDGFEPLDLLAGHVSLRLEVDARGVVQDETRHRVPEVVTDLRNDDLVAYMTAMATGSPFALTDLDRARRLMLDRLRADWRRAVHASGNPYKRDYKRGGAETALGELVVAVASHDRGLARPEVFDGMAGDVVALSRDLPGIHPMLRKSMRKLAWTLP